MMLCAYGESALMSFRDWMFISGLTPVIATSSIANTETSVVHVGFDSDCTYWKTFGSGPDFSLSLSSCLYSNFSLEYETT